METMSELHGTKTLPEILFSIAFNIINYRKI